MHFDPETMMIVTLVIASLVLVFHAGDRVFPLVAVVAAGLEALIAFRLITLSSPRFQIHSILAAILVVAGAVCWVRSATKPTITAATIVVLLGAFQLLHALHL